MINADVCLGSNLFVPHPHSARRDASHDRCESRARRSAAHAARARGQRALGGQGPRAQCDS